MYVSTYCFPLTSIIASGVKHSLLLPIDSLNFSVSARLLILDAKVAKSMLMSALPSVEQLYILEKPSSKAKYPLSKMYFQASCSSPSEIAKGDDEM